MGPGRDRSDELEILLEKLDYLAQGAELVVFAGSLPRDVDPGFYGEAIRALDAPGVPTVLDSDGEPLRLGVEAGPTIVSPNQREAESLVGQELNDDEDFQLALDRIREMGARNVLITQETGCLALLREDGELRRFRAVAPQIEPVSAVGAGDVLLAAFLAARHAGRPLEESLRLGGRRGRRVGARDRRRPLRPAPGGAAPGARRGDRAGADARRP